MNHVRVFRRIEPNTVRFEVRSFSGRTGGVHSTIAEAAQEVKAKATEHGHVADVFIVFYPEHGMVWQLGEQFAHRCEPLRPMEQHEFWQAFNAE